DLPAYDLPAYDLPAYDVPADDVPDDDVPADDVQRDDEAPARLAQVLARVARAARDAVREDRSARSDEDQAVLRVEGGDEVFGVDERADAALLEGFAELIGPRWPGLLVMEGHDEPLTVGTGKGPWRYLVDPLDGTRPYLADKRSAWILIGAGRHAETLEDLELGVAVEVPTARVDRGLVAWATTLGKPHVLDEDLTGGRRGSRPVTLRPRRGAIVDRSFVTVARFAPGAKAVIGAWEDRLLAGLEVYEDPWLCTGGLLMGLATGSDAAVLDPRPLLAPGTMAAHPYDLAALVIARAAGVVVESLPPGPLAVALDPHADVAWAGYANAEIATMMRSRLSSVQPPNQAGARSSR
ncbi:MAG: hypothetical protein WA797_11340, partial [Acidimicrobiales bacterium]